MVLVAAVDEASTVGTIEGAAWMMTVDPVGDSSESGAATTTVHVDVAVRPVWTVAT